MTQRDKNLEAWLELCHLSVASQAYVRGVASEGARTFLALWMPYYRALRMFDGD